jgi:hypothetical protein
MSVSEDELAAMVMDDDGWGCAITSAPRTAPRVFRVIYAFGSTEVQSLWTHGTYEEALAEALAADDEGLDDTWVEETAS